MKVKDDPERERLLVSIEIARGDFMHTRAQDLRNMHDEDKTLGDRLLALAFIAQDIEQGHQPRQPAEDFLVGRN